MWWLWIGMVSGTMGGCAGVKVAGAPVEASAATPAEEPVSFSLLEQRVGELIDSARDADQRDRLVAMRELMFAMRGQDPPAQRRVYAHLVKVIGIEERSRPQALPEPIDPLGIVPIEELLVAPEPVAPAAPLAPEPVAPAAPVTVSPAPLAAPSPEEPAPPVSVVQPAPVDRQARILAARAALAERDYGSALEALAPLSDGEARLLRQEAVDGGAQAARARAAEALRAARALPPGPERIAALRAVADGLRAINPTFPGNADYPLVEEDLRAVEAELAGAPP